MVSFRCFFFFNDTATTEIYTLSLHDALPIWFGMRLVMPDVELDSYESRVIDGHQAIERIFTLSPADRKSTRLNSSHANISYAVFCLKKKKYTVLRDGRRPQTFLRVRA